jgi:hypothetical protein
VVNIVAFGTMVAMVDFFERIDSTTAGKEEKRRVLPL